MSAPDRPPTGDAAGALMEFLSPPGAMILIRLDRVEGSAPREAGTTMIVRENDLYGTIGGGFAEHDAIAHARALIAGRETARERVTILGPDSGQCCGGRLTLSFTPVSESLARDLIEEARATEEANRPVMIFGAGHVGKAIARALAPLPLRVTVVETRSDELEDLPANIRPLLAALPEAALSELPSGAAVLILTHDHALDFLIAREALLRDDLAYVGMIGSATKRASFAGHWKREGGAPERLDRLTLPIGGSAVKDKRPAVIAALVAAELLRLPPFEKA